MPAPTLHEAALEYMDGTAPTATRHRLEVLLVRAYMAGALEAAGRKPHETIRECLDFARTIGTPVETAR